MQEALLAAALRWPAEGLPGNPRGWLVTVASRSLVDQVRSEQARRRREDRIASATPQAELLNHAAAAAPGTDRDDSLALLFLCCHPALSGPSRIALTLRAAGGLTTAQIATAFLVPGAAMAQRISRAEQTIKASGMQLRMPESAEHVEHLGAELHVLYLIFNEGHTTTDGADLTAPALSAEALRLTRLLHRLLPDDGEAAGLPALMLLTEARRPARTGPGGDLVPPAGQDRGRWDRRLIAELIARGITGPVSASTVRRRLHQDALKPWRHCSWIFITDPAPCPAAPSHRPPRHGWILVIVKIQP